MAIAVNGVKYPKAIIKSYRYIKSLSLLELEVQSTHFLKLFHNQKQWTLQIGIKPIKFKKAKRFE